MQLAELNIAKWKIDPASAEADGFMKALDEAKARLMHLNEHGNIDQAFDWSHLPHIKLWQSQTCA